MVYQRARGLRKVSAVITVAAAATPETLYLLTAAGTVTRTVVIRKIMMYSNVGLCVISIGTGLGGAFAAIMPNFIAVNAIDTEILEEELPEVEVSANLTVQSDVLGVQIQIEVEEIGAS